MRGVVTRQGPLQMVVYPATVAHARCAIVVRSVTAVQRNRMRRRMVEALRPLMVAAPAANYIIRVSSRAEDLSREELTAMLSTLFSLGARDSN